MAPEERPAALDELSAKVAVCERCQLCKNRTQAVFGVGSATAPVVFVGEGPGADEDRLGEPFVGAAGQLLNAMLGAAGFQREEIYIANVVKCRPPGNRNPLPEEMALCQGYLYQQLEIIRPQMIFALGKFAIQSLLGHTGAIAKVRGRIHHWRGTPVAASYHPAFFLRAPTRKREGWEDLLRLRAHMRTLDQSLASDV
ncbi:putative uracil-DNA glycosylase, family 4 [Magnetofaba australis IT-1]|uniref:Type-4 uracil-DNA glycosylase n=1 Tax=Magnetofaba australis IT-1 TaxID=1434232 RepID=A0A1Y2K409_9PROT|nr:putative uracil-DNA glycosylase, family 4 [Magnetofaba australis IT-1]